VASRRKCVPTNQKLDAHKRHTPLPACLSVGTKTALVIRRMWARSVFVQWSVLVLLSAHAEARPPLMPSRLESSPERYTASSSSRREPIRLGLQVGAMSFNRIGTAEVFGGLRLFSRFSFWNRFYLVPSVGFYRMVSPQVIGSSPGNLVEMGLQLNFALIRLGGFGLLVGVAQRFGYQFATDTSSYPDQFYYRLGPSVSVNLRFSRSTTFVVGADAVTSVSGPIRPEIGAHLGFLFGF
jgi:hypothetical protein